jgi:hypothetical protein
LPIGGHLQGKLILLLLSMKKILGYYIIRGSSLFRKIFTLGKIVGLLVLSAGFFTAKGNTSL